MKYKALKMCNFDRRYSVGEFIDESVIDKQCLPRAVKYGYIAKVESVEEVDVEETPVEAVEASESEAVEEVDEEPQEKQRGRKKANKEA